MNATAAPPRRERPDIYLYDDARARRFEPFALTRPIASLVAGAAPIWSRWQVALQGPVAGVLCAPHLGEFRESDAPPAAAGILPTGAIVANSRFVPAGEILAWRGFDLVSAHGQPSPVASADAWTAGGRVTAVRLAAPIDTSRFADGSLTLEELATGAQGAIQGWWHDEIWDFVSLLGAQLTDDINRCATEPESIGLRGRVKSWSPPSHTTVLGKHPVLVHGEDRDRPGHGAAVIEPHVVLDATAGPIYIAAGAIVRSFTRITGPCFIGREATIMGGDVTGCSIGPMAKVRGEISSTIVHGYSNKGHDGFVGHSYLGRWVNLGAGTVTSNLKNTYGTVALWTPDGVRDTGLQFLGTLFGDHVKTGIGLKLTTGTVLGAGANVYGSEMPPKAVSPFAWGESRRFSTYHLDKFIETAERMMSRRHVELSAEMKRTFAAAFERRWTPDLSKGE